MAAPVPGSDVRQMAALPCGFANGRAQWRCQPSTPQRAEALALPCTASTAAGSQPSIDGSSNVAQTASPRMSTLACDRQAAATKNPVARLWRWLSSIPANCGNITEYSRGYSRAAAIVLDETS